MSNEVQDLHAVTRLLDKEMLEYDKDGHLVDYVLE